jgi:hypothetical protein
VGQLPLDDNGMEKIPRFTQAFLRKQGVVLFFLFVAPLAFKGAWYLHCLLTEGEKSLYISWAITY